MCGKVHRYVYIHLAESSNEGGTQDYVAEEQLHAAQIEYTVSYAREAFASVYFKPVMLVQTQYEMSFLLTKSEEMPGSVPIKMQKSC